MDWIRRTTMVLVAVSAVAQGAAAQDRSETEAAYLSAVAEFFRVPATEMAIMRDWELTAHEIPVVLFIANRAGVSPEALASLRRTGGGWDELSQRYGVGGDALHVPIPDSDDAGRLSAAYQRFRSTAVDEWAGVGLSSDDVVALVNVRLLSQTLGVPPAEILRRAGPTMSFVDLYGELIN